MVKKILIIFFFSFVMISNVSAESYYENNLGVKLSEDEYNFISALYGSNYLERITPEIYDKLKEYNIFGQEIITVNDDNQISTYGLIETPYKKLSTSYACGSMCAVSASLTWKKVPATKSYDLFGAYLNGASEIMDLSSRMFVNGSSSEPTEYKINSTGSSATHKLPSTISANNAFVVDFSFMVAKKGSIYISYQHAAKSLSLANSRKYSFGLNGYGNVFVFNESIRSYYDDMSGLKIQF